MNFQHNWELYEKKVQNIFFYASENNRKLDLDQLFLCII